MTIVHIKELDELKTLINGKGKIAVDFFATWCGPCKRISPEFERLSNEESMKEWTFVKIDVDEAEEIAAEYSISQMPTFMFFKNGALADRYADSGLENLMKRLTEL